MATTTASRPHRRGGRVGALLHVITAGLALFAVAGGCGSTSSSDSPNPDRATTSQVAVVSTTGPTTAGTTPGNDDHGDVSAPGFDLPEGMTVTDTSVGDGGKTTVTATCSGKGSAAVTDLTTALNTSGYSTKWIMSTSDRPPVVEGRSSNGTVRATISTDAAGTCTKVVIVSEP